MDFSDGCVTAGFSKLCDVVGSCVDSGISDDRASKILQGVFESYAGYLSCFPGVSRVGSGSSEIVSSGVPVRGQCGVATLAVCKSCGVFGAEEFRVARRLLFDASVDSGGVESDGGVVEQDSVSLGVCGDGSSSTVADNAALSRGGGSTVLDSVVECSRSVDLDSVVGPECLEVSEGLCALGGCSVVDEVFIRENLDVEEAVEVRSNDEVFDGFIGSSLAEEQGASQVLDGGVCERGGRASRVLREVSLGAVDATTFNVESREVRGNSQGRWYRSNQKKKDKKKQVRCGGGKGPSSADWRVKSVVSEVDELRLSASGGSREVDDLRLSLERKWKAENELAAERASRQLEVLRANDIQQEVRKYRTNISAATERNMVSIEKTHALLKATGNVPEDVGGGFAETMVSGEPGLTDGSISPDSSASMKEFRLCQKKLLDAEALIVKYQAATGWSPEALDVLKKHVWTDTPENHELLDSLYPDGYGIDNDCDSGKFCVVGL